MARKVLIAGASGVVGYAAMKHFAAQPDCEVIAVSRRAPAETFGVRFCSADLTDRAACADLFGGLRGVTHLVYAALHERPELIAGWREDAQIHTNDAMLRHLFDPLLAASPGLRHVTLLQGTKAYGIHVRPMRIPAREDKSEMREQPNFYWLQEDYLKDRQRGRDWAWTVFRPQIIFGESTGSAMNLIPAIGVYGALLRAQGRDLAFPGGPTNILEAIDADLLARAIDWAGEAAAARGQAFNVTNGDLFLWENVWPAIADALGMRAGEPTPLALATAIPARSAEWDSLRRRHGLVSPGLAEFVGASFQYADYCLNHGRSAPGPHSIVSTIKLRQAGFGGCIDTEAMFRKWFRVLQDRRLLPPV